MLLRRILFLYLRANLSLIFLYFSCHILVHTYLHTSYVPMYDFHQNARVVAHFICAKEDIYTMLHFIFAWNLHCLELE